MLMGIECGLWACVLYCGYYLNYTSKLLDSGHFFFKYMVDFIYYYIFSPDNWSATLWSFSFICGNVPEKSDLELYSR